jgi:E-phenylitaconyl-CoA hydratase
MTAADDVLLVERRDSVLVATMNRPAAMNALDTALRARLADFWEAVRDDGDVAVAVVTGAGSRAFSSGRDLKETAAAYDRGAEGTAAEMTGRMGYPTDLRVGKPVVAAVNGYCLAAGLKLAIGCDVRIAAATAEFGNPQVRVGRGTDMPLRLLKAGVPQAVVHDMTYTGRRVSAEEALHWGLVSRVVPPDELLEVAVSTAATIAENSPMVVRTVKGLLDDGVAELPLAEALARWQVEPGLFGATADAREGARAFAEHRAPRYRQEAADS